MFTKVLHKIKEYATSPNEDKNPLKTVSKMKCYDFEQVTPTLKLVKFVVNGPVDFMAGQFIGVHPQDISKDFEEHQIFSGTFSIASCPSSLPVISFAVCQDDNPRNMRHFMYQKLKKNDILFVDQKGWGTVALTPRMLMTPIGGPGGLCLISGGTAIIGQLSIVDELLQNPEGRLIPKVTLIHSNRSAEDIPFHLKLRQLAEDNKVEYILRITDKEFEKQTEKPKFSQFGRIDKELLRSIAMGKRLFCVCGSGPMVEAIVELLLDIGVWPGSIKTDYTTRIDPSNQSLMERRASRQIEAKLSMGKGGSQLLKNKKDSNKTPAPKQKQPPKMKKAFMSTPDGSQGETNADKDFETYFHDSGLKSFFQDLTIQLKEEKPPLPFQFCLDKLNDRLDKVPEVQNENAKDPNFWMNYWETDNVKWHSPVISPWLKTYYKNLFDTEKELKVFVPLCGKSVDMVWLCNQGQVVVGSDCSGIALQDFFSTNYVFKGYKREPVNQGFAVHTSLDLPNCCLFEGDIFKISPDVIGGKVDRILDRAALVALPPSLAESYLQTMTSLLKPNGKVLFASVSHLPHPVAPPHMWKKEQIEPLLNKFFEKVTMLTVHKYKVNAGEVHEPIYLLEKPYAQIIQVKSK